MTATTEEKEQFVTKAIQRLRNVARSKGIHVKFSGFNEAFRMKFGEEPRAFTEKMAAEGKIMLRPAKMGAMMYLLSDAPDGILNPGQAALDKIEAE